MAPCLWAEINPLGWADSVDLYIATLGAEGWSSPVPLRELNTDGADIGVASSPDGRWLYYKNNSRFMRVDIGVRPRALRWDATLLH